MKQLIISVFIASLTVFVYPQQKSDSLLNLLKNSKNDSSRVKILLSLTRHLNFTGIEAKNYSEEGLALAREINHRQGIADALYHLSRYDYYISSYQDAAEKSKLSYDLFCQMKDINGMALSLMCLGDANYSLDNFAIAVSQYDSAIVLFEKINSEVGMANCLLSKGDVFYVQDNYPEALINYKKALEFYEKNGTTMGIANCINCIADVLFDQEDFDQAKGKYLKARSLFISLDDLLGLGNCTKRLGDIEFKLANYGKSLEFFNEAYGYYSKAGTVNGLGNTTRNLGEVYLKRKDYQAATEKMNEAISIFKETGDGMGQASSLINLATIKKEQGKIKDAIELAEKAFTLGSEINTPEIVQGAAFELGELYFINKQFEKAYFFQKLYSNLKDSINSNENVKKITRMQMQIDFDQKEREQKLIQQQKELEHEMKLNEQKMVRNSFIGGCFLLLLLSFFIFKNYRNKQKANNLLSEKNQIIELKNREITDSIEYAQQIQKSMLVSDDQLKSVFPEHFVIFRPRDIISGDFYWAAPLDKTGNGNSGSTGGILAVGDCTGHGVPGALMSMIGNTLLNKIVNENKIETPSEILNNLRSGVIEILHQKGGERDCRDGIDMAVVALRNLSSCRNEKCENEKWILEFSGAHNPAWIILNEKSSVKELKADNLPVGFFWGVQNTFTNQKITVEKSDVIYLFSDGYADQFGGRKKKKFKQSRLKELLLSIHKKPMEEQKNILNKALDDWMTGLEQVDDICLIGLRV